MAILEQICCNQILKPCSRIRAKRPVPKIELFIFFQSLYPVRCKGSDPETIVQVFQDPYPAIHRLMGGLDDILDLVNEAAQRVVRYKITEVPAPVGEATRILVEATQACERAVAGLRNMKTAANILEECEKINACENAADVVNSAAVAELFETGGDPLMVIKWRDIYDSLENAADATEDVANIVEGIVLEHG